MEGHMVGSRITPSVDTKVGAAYLELTDDTMVETIEAAADIQVDNDGTGTVVGVEVLNFAADLPLDALVGRFHFPAADAELVLRQIRPSIQHSVSSVGSGQGLRGGAPVANTKSKQR